MGFFNCSRRLRYFGAAVACAAAFGPSPLAAQPASANFLVFVRAVTLGTEQVTVERTADGWTITSTGRVSPPLDMALKTFRLRYDANWAPLDLTIDATVRGQETVLKTTVQGTAATNSVSVQGAAPAEKNDTIDAHAVLLPNGPVAPYEGLAARLRTAKAGDSIAAYQPPAGSFAIDVGESSVEKIQTVSRTIDARRTRFTVRAPNLPSQAAELWSDEQGRLLRVSVPAQGLEFVREDIASVGARVVTMARPNDENVLIPANGFSLAGTVSKPAAGTGPFPAVLLVSGSGLTDRDETVSGIPIFGQLANRLADAGFLVLRYDKRGVGQSGGRPESATLTDFAEDAKAAVKLLADRKDVDRKKVALVGHSEGGWVAMLAAASNNRVTSIALLATPGSTGADLNMYQVEHGLERSTRSADEKQKTVAMQRQIQQAVLTGKGWESLNLPEPTRRQADTPYFQSFLRFDPARLMKDVKQPLLVLQGELDRQVPVASADTLESLAKARKGAAAVRVVKVPAVNHLLVPATTGEIDEYASLSGRPISPALGDALVDWLKQQ